MSTDARPTALRRLGRYELRSQVGEGGMGVVYRAVDPEGRHVAVKVLRPQIAGDEEGRARFAREVRAMRRVRGPHVAEVLDADITASTPYVVTRYVDGPPLSHVVAENGPLGTDEAIRLGKGLADALRAVHAAGVVHRDLKPGNVLMVDGEPVVIDFGISQVADETRLTSTGLVVGTPGYLAPEVIEGRPATSASDIHSWGATLAYAVSGHPPFGRGPMEAVMYRVTRGQADLSGVPDRLRPAVRAAMDLDPLRRPSAGELDPLVEGTSAAGRARTEVLPAAGRSEQRSRTKALPERRPARTYAPPAARPRRHPFLAALLLLVAAAAGAVAPLVALAGLFCAAVLGRTVDRQGRLLRHRRERRGPGASNGLVAAGALPWHAIRSVLFTVLTFPIALAGAGVLEVVVAFIGPAVSGIADLHVLGALALAAAGLVCWWGIEGESLRSGSRRVLDVVTRPRPVGVAAALVLVLVAIGLAVTAVQGPVSLWPLPYDRIPLTDWPDRVVDWVRGLRFVI